jgi:hypothetical protein
MSFITPMPRIEFEICARAAIRIGSTITIISNAKKTILKQARVKLRWPCVRRFFNLLVNAYSFSVPSPRLPKTRLDPGRIPRRSVHALTGQVLGTCGGGAEQQIGCLACTDAMLQNVIG